MVVVLKRNATSKGQTYVGSLILDRPDSANAFNAEMMASLTHHLETLATDPQLLALIITGKGKHFSAGADLGWMKNSVKLSYADNVEDAQKLTKMFEALANFPRPTIAVAHGAVYGGAVGLVACCDSVIASESAKFCLSEVRLGLIPAVIYPYLGRRLLPSALKRLALTGRRIDAREAKRLFLVDEFGGDSELNLLVNSELQLFLHGGPEAQGQLKTFHRQVAATQWQQSDLTATAIARARSTAEAQAALKGFFDKQRPPHDCKWDQEWDIHG